MAKAVEVAELVGAGPAMALALAPASAMLRPTMAVPSGPVPELWPWVWQWIW